VDSSNNVRFCGSNYGNLTTSSNSARIILRSDGGSDGSKFLIQLEELKKIPNYNQLPNIPTNQENSQKTQETTMKMETKIMVRKIVVNSSPEATTEQTTTTTTG